MKPLGESITNVAWYDPKITDLSSVSSTESWSQQKKSFRKRKKAMQQLLKDWSLYDKVDIKKHMLQRKLFSETSYYSAWLFYTEKNKSRMKEWSNVRKRKACKNVEKKTSM